MDIPGCNPGLPVRFGVAGWVTGFGQGLPVRFGVDQTLVLGSCWVNGIADVHGRHIEAGILIVALALEQIEGFNALIQSFEIEHKRHFLVIFDVARFGRSGYTFRFQEFVRPLAVGGG